MISPRLEARDALFEAVVDVLQRRGAEVGNGREVTLVALTNCAMVLMPARLRQLRERSVRPSSSMRMSSSLAAAWPCDVAQLQGGRLVVEVADQFNE